MERTLTHKGTAEVVADGLDVYRIQPKAMTQAMHKAQQWAEGIAAGPGPYEGHTHAFDGLRFKVTGYSLRFLSSIHRVHLVVHFDGFDPTA